MTKRAGIVWSVGFTLIEMMVALILVALITVAVFTVVLQQLDRHHAVLLGHDLVRIGTGVEMLNANLQTVFPSDIEDLIYAPGDDDLHLDLTTEYSASERRRWNGPYIDVVAVPEGGDVWEEEIESGFSARIQSGLYCFDVASNFTASCVRNVGRYLAVEVQNITVAEFEKLNDVIDGEGEDDTTNGSPAESWQHGRLRMEDAGGISPGDQVNFVYFLIRPYSW